MNEKIRLVSERDPKMIAAQNAANEIAGSIKEVAANILRIIAGAGKSRTLIDDIAKAIEPFERFKEVGSIDLLSEAIDHDLRDLDWRRDLSGYIQRSREERERDGTAAVERAQWAIVQAALRLVAAQLVAQPTQEAQAEHQLVMSVQHFEEIWDEHRRRATNVRL